MITWKEFVNLSPDEQERLTEEFRKGLAALTEKHGFKIAGCGCCGSPRVDVAENPRGWYSVSFGSEQLKFNPDEDHE